MNLSPTMLDVLGRMRSAGGRIERWPGGFWTTPGIAFSEKTLSAGTYRVPAWSRRP